MLRMRFDTVRPLTSAAVMATLLLSVPVAAAQEETTPWVQGPQTVDLGDIATVDLGDGYLFADGETTRKLMESMGNPPSGQEVGLIAPAAEDRSWFVVFEFNSAGYVTDEDQGEIDADALLKSISEGTEAANEYRREMGGGELHVTGWSEAPHYDPATHNLLWALEAVDEESDRIVNYNVRLLGREGYMSVTLVTDPETLARDKPEVETVLANFSYKDGKRYGDYVSGDKLAGYGLAALVAGGAGAAAAKLGLFAVLGKFLAKAWKLLVLGAVAAGAAIKRFFAALDGGGPARREIG